MFEYSVTARKTWRIVSLDITKKIQKSVPFDDCHLRQVLSQVYVIVVINANYEPNRF